MPPTRLAAAVGAIVLLVSACGAPSTGRRQSLALPSLDAGLWRPAGDRPSPAVVLLPGGTGVEPNHPVWAGWLAEQGYVAMLIQTGRYPDVSAMVGQALTARDYLRSQPFVDGDRIAVMGFSRGGAAVLTAQTVMGDAPPREPPFRAGIAFYPPGCSPRIQRLASPLLLFLGGADGSPQLCLDLQQRLGASGGGPVDVVVFPGALHAFDDARWRTATPSESGPPMQYDSAATAVAQSRIRAFLATHLRGP